MADLPLLENISNIYKRMSHAAMRAGRNPDDIKLIAVTKTVSIEMVRQAVDAGLRIFGESKVQEAIKKVMSDELRVTSNKIKWHLIGHLQKNKAKAAVELFDMIQSVDSLELAETLNKQAEKLGKIQEVLIQVKLSVNDDKHGILKENLISMIGQVIKLKNLDLKGLMTIPPYFENPEDARPYFRELRELRDNINELRVTGYALRELSMGMTNDFEVAIEEGATMIRIGTAIFGERKLEEAL
ncbi:MAG: YggS family pyridoxal phosphate-dependent enzyme [Nitrospirae bacterium]|nr:MAG: YggS family pyridoxal phosphate-dependent enzyme [Nitrospirota bacterium]